MATDESREPDRHYRVIRFQPHPGHGMIEDILGENLTLSEAEALADRNYPVVHGEEVVVQDQDKIGLEADISERTLGRGHFTRQ